MKNPRHNGGASGNNDKKLDIDGPQAFDGLQRTAMHRYLPADLRARTPGKVTARAAVDDEPFSSHDFKPRWWPAPDSWQ